MKNLRLKILKRKEFTSEHTSTTILKSITCMNTREGGRVIRVYGAWRSVEKFCRYFLRRFFSNVSVEKGWQNREMLLYGEQALVIALRGRFRKLGFRAPVHGQNWPENREI
jgi:hypothetical protein